MQPGPLAYHALICAYCKAQDSQGALSATRRAAQEGGPGCMQQQCGTCTGAGMTTTSPTHTPLDASMQVCSPLRRRTVLLCMR